MESKWVLLESGLSPVEADIKKGFLESNGVFPMLESVELNRALPHMQIAFGGGIIKVQEKDLTKSQNLLANLPSESFSFHEYEEDKKDLKDEGELCEDLEAFTKRALNVAIIGMIFCPGIINFISIQMLLQLSNNHKKLTSMARSRIRLATGINFLSYVTLAVFVFFFLKKLYGP